MNKILDMQYRKAHTMPILSVKIPLQNTYSDTQIYIFIHSESHTTNVPTISAYSNYYCYKNKNV